MESYREIEEVALARNESIKATFHFIWLPLFFLSSVVLVSLAFYYFKVNSLLIAVPTIISMSGVIVAFIGAYWDFGAKKYLEDLARNRIQFNEKDVSNINKKQLHLTIIFLGIAGLYFLTGYLTFYFLIS